ncbi:MAG: CamS family sex pheromone protein [Erysipelothrix sp.]|nr:CamS family sex pheromone protein [Erysipelothrix sp.]
MKHKIVSLLCGLLFLSACAPSQNGENPNIIRKEGDYAIVDDFNPSVNRSYHGTYLPIHQALEVGSRLVELSKQHFDVSEYSLAEGKIITLSRLAALVRRESATNPIGLNPPSGSLFPSGTGEDILDAVLVSDVLELNFMQKRGDELSLAGISIAIVLNPSQSVGLGRVNVSAERMYEYGSDMGRKLESYLRSLAGVGDVPIYITLYSLASVDAILPGGMIGEGLFLSRSGQITSLNEYWLLIPSNASNELDPLTHSVFLQLKSRLQTLLPEAIGVFAKARVVNQRIDTMIIEVNSNVKTYTELLALTQIVLNEVNDFEERRMDIKIHIKNLNSTLVLIEKKANDDEFTIIYLN